MGHMPFTQIMIKTVQPILAKAVGDGTLDWMEAAKIETAANRSFYNPFYQLSEKHQRIIINEVERQLGGVR